MTISHGIHYLNYRHLFKHLLINIEAVLILIAVCLFIGMCGYHYFEHFDWVDSFLNAAMILGGMGPSNPLVTTGGKIFAGLYALFSGLAFIAIIALMLSPVFHAVFQKVKLEEK